MKKPRQDAGQMQQLLAEYKQSTDSLKEFARKKGMPHWRLVYWFYRRFRDQPDQSPPSLVEVAMANGGPTAGPHLPHYRVELPGGIGLSFSGPVRREDLEQLLQLLRS